MCGRFSLATPPEEIARFFNLVALPRLKPRYNIAPTQDCAVIRAPGDDARELVMMRWGLIPSWAKDMAIGNRMINARGESVGEKPAFRAAFRKRRCLVPADGFYEWKKDGKAKQPYWIGRPGRVLFAFAGLWERWQGEGAEPIESFTIITTDANDAISGLHDRMPAILDPAQYDAWLDPANEDAGALSDMLDPAPVKMLEFHPVGTRINSPKNDDPSLLEPPPQTLFGE